LPGIRNDNALCAIPTLQIDKEKSLENTSDLIQIKIERIIFFNIVLGQFDLDFSNLSVIFSTLKLPEISIEDSKKSFDQITPKKS